MYIKLLLICPNCGIVQERKIVNRLYSEAPLKCITCRSTLKKQFIQLKTNDFTLKTADKASQEALQRGYAHLRSDNVPA